MLERSHLAILLALDNAGTLAEAAERLHLTQSALSHAIRKLEDQAGVALWRKEGRRLRLTQAGQYLLGVARRLLPQMEEADSVLRGYGEGRRGKLRIGMECHPCYEWLLTVVSPFLQRWPLVDLDVVQQFRFNGLEALLNHQVDMVITSDPLENPAFQNRPVFTYELMLVAAPDWRSDLAGVVSPDDLTAATLITFPVARERLDVFTRFLLPAHCEPNKLHQVEATEIMVQLVAAGRGVCTLPDWLARKFQASYPLVIRSLGAEGVHKSLYLVFREEDAEVSYLQDFLALAQHPG
jgi:LysR family transcriptional regulator for metE and metH